MPYALAQVDGGWKVRDETGKFYSDKPLSRKGALAQMRALYVHAPDTDKKEVSGPMGVNASGPGSAGVVGLEKPEVHKGTESMDSIAEKHGQHNQKTHGQRWGMAGLREYAKKSGLTVRTMNDGKIGIFGKKGDRTNMRATGITSAKKLIRSHNKWKREGERDLARARRDSEERVRVINQARTGKKPAGAKPPSKSPGNLQALGAGTKKAPARSTVGGKKVSGSGVFKKGGESYAYYTTTGRDGRRSYTFDGGKTWQRDQLDAFISAAGGYENAYPILSQRKEALDILLSDDGEYTGASILENPASLSVFKDSDGRYRWILQSSNAFRDRDNEIVSTKALEEDVEAADANGSYGPLRWWHCKGYDLGDCDFRMVHGRTLIESGTFRSNAIGERVKAHAGQLQVSIGFNHPMNEPDREGVFHHIRTFERSLLPAGKAANPFTRVIVKGVDEMATKEEKLKALKALGIDPDAVLQQAEQTEKELERQGVAFKENEAAAEAEAADTAEKETGAVEPPAESESEKAKKPPKPEEDPEDSEDSEEDSEEEEGEEEEEVIGNMSKKEYADHLRATVKEALAEILEPVLKSIHTHDPQADKDAHEKEASERAALKEQIDAQQGKIEALTAQLSATQGTLKESQEALQKATAGLGEAGSALKSLHGRLSELEGSQTRAGAAGGYDAANDDSTVISAERAKELGGPIIDPAAKSMMDFTQNFLLGGN